jgi:biopolymer transport protein ExbB
MHSIPAQADALARPPVRERRTRCLGTALLALAAFVCSPSSASAWWNDEWSLRKEITIDTSSVGAGISDPIGSVAILIRLHAGNFRFGQAKEDGSDLRFVAADDKTPLEYHVEKYDSLLGEAFVWVAVPNLEPGAKKTFWLYYGNAKAQAVANAKATYDPNMVLVYHASGRGTPPQDSSRWANHATAGGQNVDGAIIGSAMHFDGGAPLTLPASPSLAMTAGAEFTWSAWVKPSVPQATTVIYSRREGSSGLLIGLDGGSPFVEVTVDGNVQRSVATAPAAPSGWFHVAVAARPGRVTLTLDGNAYASLDASLPALNSVAFVGADPAAEPPTDTATAATESLAQPTASDGRGFTGDIDELQISNVARPTGFVKASVIEQGPDHGRLVAYGTDEETSSWASGYFIIILQSVTTDGWVVIGLLGIMSVVSWIVMIGKVRYLARQSKANTRFMHYYHELAADLGTRSRGGGSDHAASLDGRIGPADLRLLHQSSLYRIFQIGSAEVRDRFADADQPLVLSSQSIAAIRAALDGGVVRENQRLNNLMVLLTIAISGGPFLGLLGTVVGVMITFAAIAASGDVNVNAIAPGIAAALVATVAGLGVAIPALFGYNYLITRIKDLGADMQVFVDEMTTRMAEDFDSSTRRNHRSLAAE